MARYSTRYLDYDQILPFGGQRPSLGLNRTALIDEWWSESRGRGGMFGGSSSSAAVEQRNSP